MLNIGSRVFLTTFCCIVFLFGNILNAMLLIIILRSKQIRQMLSSMFLISLLAFQLAACLYEVPYYIISLAVDLPPAPNDNYTTTCWITMFITYLIGNLKVLILTLMSMDRYMAICHPFFYSRFISKSRVRISLVYIWIQTLSFTVPLLAMDGWTRYEGKCGYACGLNWNGANIYYITLAALMTILIPALIMIVTNVTVYFTARRQRLRIASQSKHITDIERRSSMETRRNVESNCANHACSNDCPATFNSSQKASNSCKQISITETADCFESVGNIGHGGELQAGRFSNESPQNLKTDAKTKSAGIPKQETDNENNETLGCKNHSSDSSIQNDPLKVNNRHSKENSCSDIKNYGGSEKIEPSCNNEASSSQLVDELTTKAKSIRRLKSQASTINVSWSLVSSTLLVVLAFFITYTPFGITRVLLTFTVIEESQSLIAYTAVLTIIMNLLNPLILLGTRKELKYRFLVMLGLKQSHPE